MKLTAYGMLAILALAVTLLLWRWSSRRADAPTTPKRMLLVCAAGLFGALIGAKLAFLLAEGWRYQNNWTALISGRSITGALLGGYLAVEWIKRLYDIRKSTGDFFAISIPISLIIGRVGCLIQGCCPGVACAAHWWTLVDDAGVHRWPAAGIELLFNAAFLAWTILARRFAWAIENRFHVYLIAYGIFRFAHEFQRDTARVFGEFTGYHALAIALAILGLIRYAQRVKHLRAETVRVASTTSRT